MLKDQEGNNIWVLEQNKAKKSINSRIISKDHPNTTIGKSTIVFNKQTQ